MSEAYYELEITPPGGAPEIREVRQPTLAIGRRDGDVVIRDAGASGRHAEVRFDGGALVVRDLGSTNGILFQGAITREPFELGEGERFQIGRTRFRLVSVHVPAPAPAAAPDDEDLEKTAVGRPSFDLDADDEPALTERAPAPRTVPPEPQAVADPEPEKTAFLATEDPGPTRRAPAEPPPRAESPPPADAAPPPTGKMEEAEATAWLEVPQEAKAEPPAPEPEPATEGAGGGESTAFLSTEQAPAPEADWTIEEEGWGSAPAEPRVEQGGGGGSGGGAPAWAQAYMGDDEEPAPPSAETRDAPGPPGAAVRPAIAVTGADLFKELFVGFLLTAITLGIYAPWFYVRLTRDMAERTVVGPTARGRVQLRFDGTGGELFVTAVVGYLLTAVTLGIYGFWFATNLARFFVEHTEGVAPDGTRYRARFTLSGGAFFKEAFLGAVLTMITLGIYAPWFICKLHALFKGHTLLFEDGRHVGGLQFHGEGGDLFGQFLVGYLLTLITVGIYAAWFQVSLKRFFASYTTVNVDGRVFQGGFTGTGGELFLIHFVGMLLIPLTLGIYFFWFIARLVRFGLNHLSFEEIEV